MLLRSAALPHRSRRLNELMKSMDRWAEPVALPSLLWAVAPNGLQAARSSGTNWWRPATCGLLDLFDLPLCVDLTRLKGPNSQAIQS